MIQYESNLKQTFDLIAMVDELRFAYLRAKSPTAQTEEIWKRMNADKLKLKEKEWTTAAPSSARS